MITGASRGIGPVLATFYARAGGTLVLVARNAALLNTVKESIQKEAGADIITYALDVKDTQTAAKVIEEIVNRYGRIDVVIANAGVHSPPGGSCQCIPL